MLDKTKNNLNAIGDTAMMGNWNFGSVAHGDAAPTKAIETINNLTAKLGGAGSLAQMAASKASDAMSNAMHGLQNVAVAANISNSTARA